MPKGNVVRVTPSHRRKDAKVRIPIKVKGRRRR